MKTRVYRAECGGGKGGEFSEKEAIQWQPWRQCLYQVAGSKLGPRQKRTRSSAFRIQDAALNHARGGEKRERKRRLTSPGSGVSLALTVPASSRPQGSRWQTAAWPVWHNGEETCLRSERRARIWAHISADSGPLSVSKFRWFCYEPQTPGTSIEDRCMDSMWVSGDSDKTGGKPCSISVPLVCYRLVLLQRCSVLRMWALPTLPHYPTSWLCDLGEKFSTCKMRIIRISINCPQGCLWIKWEYACEVPTLRLAAWYSFNKQWLFSRLQELSVWSPLDLTNRSFFVWSPFRFSKWTQFFLPGPEDSLLVDVHRTESLTK